MTSSHQWPDHEYYPHTEAGHGASAAMALLHEQRCLKLAELACSIREDPDLSWLVIEEAAIECAMPEPTLEQAIVLLGTDRLRALLACPGACRHSYRFIPPASFCPSEGVQGEAE